MAVETRNSIAIIAMGPSGADYFGDYGHGRKVADEVWAINHAGLWYPGVDLIFAMDDMVRDLDIDLDYIEALKASGKRIMTCRAHFENCENYPTGDVCEMLPYTMPPLDNTCTFALAYAIYKEASEIRLYGFDFFPRDSPEALLRADRRWWQRLKNPPKWFAYHDVEVVQDRRPREPGVISTTWMAGYAAAKGIKVWIAPSSTFLDTDREYTVHGFNNFPL